MLRDKYGRLAALEAIVKARKAAQDENEIDPVAAGELWAAFLEEGERARNALSPEQREAEIAAFVNGRTLHQIAADWQTFVQGA